MRLPIENPNPKEIQSRIKDFANKSRTDKGRKDSVYVLECDKPESKESAIETSKELLEEYSTNNEIKYRDPNKKVGNKTTTKPSSFKEALNSKTKNVRDDPYISYPYWIEYCYKADNIYYVGWSNKVDERISDHVTNDGALFTKIFSPMKIEEIRWYPSKSAAKEAEGKVANEYSDIEQDQREDLQNEYNNIIDFLQHTSELDADIHEDRVRKYAYYF